MPKTNSVIFIIGTLLLLERADSLAASNNTCPSNCVPTKDNTSSCIGDEMPCTANGINYCCFNQPPLKK
jgi:hypothetical protein